MDQSAIEDPDADDVKPDNMVLGVKHHGDKHLPIRLLHAVPYKACHILGAADAGALAGCEHLAPAQEYRVDGDVIRWNLNRSGALLFAGLHCWKNNLFKDK